MYFFIERVKTFLSYPVWYLENTTRTSLSQGLNILPMHLPAQEQGTKQEPYSQIRVHSAYKYVAHRSVALLHIKLQCISHNSGEDIPS